MNILPKKKWHVRTKENIARVKADEAKFDEEQRQKNYRILLAEQESRTELLRKRSSNALVPGSSSSISSKTLLSDCSVELIQGNKEYEAEKLAEQEGKEKSIGLLTYLGQSVLDSAGKKPWYDTHPREVEKTDKEKDKLKDEWEAKKKSRADPLATMNHASDWFEKRRVEKEMEESKRIQRAHSCIAAMPSLFPDDIAVPKASTSIKSSLMQSITKLTNRGKHKSKKRKRRRHDSSSEPESPPSANGHPSTSDEVIPETKSVSSAVQMAKQLKMDQLRTERLQRERRERERAAIVMAQAMGLTDALYIPAEPEVSKDERDIPFNSAFNPELSAALAERRQRHRESRKRPHSFA